MACVVAVNAAGVMSSEACGSPVLIGEVRAPVGDGVGKTLPLSNVPRESYTDASGALAVQGCPLQSFQLVQTCCHLAGRRVCGS